MYTLSIIAKIRKAILVPIISIGSCSILLVATTACAKRTTQYGIFDWEKNGVWAYPQAQERLRYNDQQLVDRGEDTMYYALPSFKTALKWKLAKGQSAAEKAEKFKKLIEDQSTPKGRKEHFERYFCVQTAGNDFGLPGLRGMRGLFAKDDLKKGQSIGVYGGVFCNQGLAVEKEALRVLGNDFMRHQMEQRKLNSNSTEAMPTGICTGYSVSLGDIPLSPNYRVSEGVSATHMRITVEPFVDKEKLYVSPAACINSAIGPNDEPGASDWVNANWLWVKFPSELPKLVVFTTKDVKAGEQLLMDYGKSYWSNSQNGLDPQKVQELEKIVQYHLNDPESILQKPRKLYRNLDPVDGVLDSEFLGL